jgi:hypothetical protein
MPFETATRLRTRVLPTLTKPSGGGVTQIDLPQSGYLGWITLNITGSISGTLSSPNPLGLASVIRRVRVITNTGLDLVNISGPGYHYLLRDMVFGTHDPVPQSNARNAVATGSFNLDMVIPIALNVRDPVGLVLLQNKDFTVTLVVEWETDTTVATGATVTATCVPVVYLFEVPPRPEDRPDISVAHVIYEDSTAIPAAGDFEYRWQRTNVYLGVYHLLTGTTYSRARLRVQEGIFLEEHTPDTMRQRFASLTGRDMNLSGALTGYSQRIFWDFLGSDGLGVFGSVRDVIDGSRLTDLTSVITAAGSGTLITIRRMLVPLLGG